MSGRKHSSYKEDDLEVNQKIDEYLELLDLQGKSPKKTDTPSNNDITSIPIKKRENPLLLEKFPKLKPKTKRIQNPFNSESEDEIFEDDDIYESDGDKTDKNSKKNIESEKKTDSINTEMLLEIPKTDTKAPKTQIYNIAITNKKEEEIFTEEEDDVDQEDDE